jgi:hypothetical protein
VAAPSPRAAEPEKEEASPPASESRAALVEQLLDRLKTGKPMLYALVSRHHRADVDRDRLRLSFLTEQKVLAEQLREKSLLSLLEEQAAAVFGKKLAIAVEVIENGAGPSAEAAPGPQAPPAKERARGEGGLEEQAKQDPLVKRFVETFQGEVEDVAGCREPARGEGRAVGSGPAGPST